MSTDSRLCSSCRKIDFESLAYVPLPADKSVIKRRWQFSQPARKDDGFYWTDYKARLLGSVASLVTRRDSCDLCALLFDEASHLIPVQMRYLDQRNNDDDSNGDEASELVSGSESENGIDEDTTSDLKCDVETMTLDNNGESLELPLKRDGHPFMCSLLRNEFGKLGPTRWKGQQVDALSVCRFKASFSDRLRTKDPNRDITSTDFQVCLDPAAGLPIKGTGREMADLVDLGLVKDWIETCRSRHGDACERPRWMGSLQPAPRLRVVDVLTKSVVSAPPGCRYLALSYVWGAGFLKTGPTAASGRGLASMALACNIADLGKEGGLACLTLPQTIQDAITLTEGLGERYLWVDALCIVQDDAEDVQTQTAAMGAVFAGAAVTIAAAAGPDADHGLPGVMPGSRINPRRKIRLSEKLSLISTVEDELRESEWRQRGWTFQEQLLSRRVLYFTKSLVWWNCNLDTWNEETILEPEKPEGGFMFENRVSSWPRSTDRFALMAFESYVSDYARRTLSYGSDILPAFQGVMSLYQEATGERLHWGLAYGMVDLGNSLMWSVIYSTSPDFSERRDLRKLLLEDGTTVLMRYPSWSWMGWTGNTGFNVNHFYWRPWVDCTRPEIDFHSLMSDGSAQRLESRKPALQMGARDGTGRRFTEPLTRLWKGLMNIDKPVITGPDDRGLVEEIVPATTPGEDSPRNGSIPVYDTGRLVFWTSHAKIKTWSGFARWEGDPELHLQLPSGVIKNSYGWDGFPSNALDLFFMSRNTSRRLFGDSHAIREPSDDADARLLSYIVVGENYAHEQWGHLITSNGNIVRRARSAFLNALIVEWIDKEQGIARRLGTAQFPEKEWMTLEREWKLVILE